MQAWLNGKILLAQQQLQFHPAVQLYVWVCLAIITHAVKDFVLITMAVVLFLMALSLDSIRFINMLRRTRWILMSILLIYAYATPGEAMWEPLGVFSPISAGVLEGWDQLLRLLIILSGLSILLSRLTQPQLLSGLYSMLLPLRLFGLSRERVAVRLALTLKYADSALQNQADNWTENLEQLLIPGKFGPGSIDLQQIQYKNRDFLLLASVSAVLWGGCF